MRDIRCTNCGAELSSACCNHPGRVIDFPMDFPPDPIPGLEAEIARLRAERDAAMAGRVKVKPLVWENFDAWTYWATSVVGTYRVQERNGVWKATIHRKDNDDLIYEYTTDGLTPDDFEAAQIAAQADYEARILDAIQPDTERAEPVAWLCEERQTMGCFWLQRLTLEKPEEDRRCRNVQPLYIAPQAREITAQEAARVPEVKALIEAAKSAADALDAAYGDPHDEETQHRYSSGIRAALAGMQKGG